MTINDEVLFNVEKIIFALRGLYSEYGYKRYRMSKFEEYDLYADNKEFLVSDDVITFTDSDGKLMALKPDVTLSIIKNSKDCGSSVNKVYYNENVYRKGKAGEEFKEIMQTGLECFGDIGEKEVAEVMILAAKSLKLVSDKCALAVSDLGVINSVVSELGLSKDDRAAVYKAIGEKNRHEIADICKINGADTKNTELLKELLSLDGDFKETCDELKKIANKYDKNDMFVGLFSALNALKNGGVQDIVRIDFSVVGDVNYYNGIVFKGFIDGAPFAVLSGGRYDNLMRKMRKNAKAIGFAVYTDAFDRFDFSEERVKPYKCADDFINVALPKGRLGEKVYGIFAAAGYECPSVLEPNRKLVFENTEKKVRYFWVKPSDVAIYVERGAADLGVAGKDILLEYMPDVYELLDLKAGKCRVAVAAPNGFKDDTTKTLRVATKFAKIAKDYYMSQGRDIDVIKLNGSIELAPILGLSDVIVDIVETGATLKENDLSVVETIVPISARLIANKAAAKFKNKRIEKAINDLFAAVNRD